MKDKLEIIKAVFEQHRAIRENSGLVGVVLNDQEAMAALEKARVDWTPGRFEALSERRIKLQQMLSRLDEGIKKHFAFEEKYLPSLLGDLMMLALLLEHGEIEKEIDETGTTITGTPLEASQVDVVQLRDNPEAMEPSEFVGLFLR